MYINGVTHVALDLSWPSRMERYLKESFGLQTLRQGYWKGDYVRVLGSPDPSLSNPGFLVLHLRTGIPVGRLNHIGFAVRDQEVPEAARELKQRGIYVDLTGDDMLYGPEDLQIQLDSYDRPRPVPTDDPAIKLMDLAIDPQLPCLVRGIHHVALEAAVPTRMIDWLCDTFGMDQRRSFPRRGEFIYGLSYNESNLDPIGRKGGLLAIFKRPEIPHVRCHHIAFDVDDAEGTMALLESKGFQVDQICDAIIHGPEDVWFQIDSRKTPFPVGHPTNSPGVTYADQTSEIPGVSHATGTANAPR